MSLKIKHSKAAYVAHSIYVDCEFSEEVDDPLAAVGKRKPQNKWCGQHTKDFFQENCNLQVIERTELSLNLTNSAA
jgi:hypothetical protein